MGSKKARQKKPGVIRKYASRGIVLAMDSCDALATHRHRCSRRLRNLIHIGGIIGQFAVGCPSCKEGTPVRFPSGRYACQGTLILE